MAPVLDNVQSLSFVLPELLLAAGAVLLFLGDLALRHHPLRVAMLTSASLAFVGTAGLALFQTLSLPITGAGDTLPDGPVALFGVAGQAGSGLLVLDRWALFFKALALAVAALSIWLAAASDDVPRARFGEYCALLLAVSVGLCLMPSAVDLLVVVVAIELTSLPSYALVAFRKARRASAEAALKYVLYGGVASGLMLFGMSYLYGLLGTSSLLGMGEAVRAAPSGSEGMLVLGVVLFLAGIGFKMAAVPFHMWCPDVYQGAPTAFTAFLSVGPKAAGFGLAVRLLHGTLSESGGGELAQALADLPWPTLMGVLAAVTMTLGNLAALRQTSVKRMLAYGSIAHAGYLLVGLSAASASGSASVALYLVLYLFMNLGAFLVVGAVARWGGDDSVQGFRGLSARAPFAAVALALLLFSLTGLPPLSGFVGKFHLFQAAVARGGNLPLGLALAGLLNSVLSLAYYARIVRAMFLEPAEGRAPVRLHAGETWLLGLCVLATVVLGIRFEPLRQLAFRSLEWLGHG